MMNTNFASVVAPRMARGGALTSAAQRVRSAGRGGDTELVHLNPREHEALKLIYGPGRTNPDTGLHEHDIFGDILGGIGDVASGVGSFLFGGSGGSGGGGALGDIISAVSGLFGGGGPTMGAPNGYANSVYGPSQAVGQQGQPGGGGYSKDNMSRLLNIGTGLASFVGALNQSRSASNQQKKLQHRQQQLQKDNSQHVSYPIGQGNPVYSSPAPFGSSSLAGLNPTPQYLSYAVGGAVGDPDDLGDGSGPAPAAMTGGGWGSRGGGPWWGHGLGGPGGGRFGRGFGGGMEGRPDRGPVMGTSGSRLPTMMPPQPPVRRPQPQLNPGALGRPWPQFSGTGRSPLPVGPPVSSVMAPQPGTAQPGATYARGGMLDHPRGQVPGAGTGQSDEVPALLSRDEYVMPADVVSHLGDGSSSAGARVLDRKVAEVRKRRTGNTRFPPRAGALSLGGR